MNGGGSVNLVDGQSVSGSAKSGNRKSRNHIFIRKINMILHMRRRHLLWSQGAGFTSDSEL